MKKRAQKMLLLALPFVFVASPMAALAQQGGTIPQTSGVHLPASGGYLALEEAIQRVAGPSARLDFAPQHVAAHSFGEGLDASPSYHSVDQVIRRGDASTGEVIGTLTTYQVLTDTATAGGAQEFSGPRLHPDSHSLVGRLVLITQAGNRLSYPLWQDAAAADRTDRRVGSGSLRIGTPTPLR